MGKPSKEEIEIRKEHAKIMAALNCSCECHKGIRVLDCHCSTMGKCLAPGYVVDPEIIKSAGGSLRPLLS